MAGDFKYAGSFRQARHFHAGRRRKVRLIVLHSAETGELPSSAEGVQSYFTTVDRAASAHLTFDSNSCAQSVKLSDTAFAAASANADGIHFEHAGRARQTRAEWLDEYGVAMLTRTAIGAADILKRFDIDPVFLRANDLKVPSRTGITTHAEVSKAWSSNGHWDPGPGFPFDWWMERVMQALAGKLTMTLEADGKLTVATASPAPKPVGALIDPWARVLKATTPAMTGPDVKAVQRALRISETGIYDLFTEQAVAEWQHTVMGTRYDDPNSGRVGQFSAKRMGITP